MGHRSKRTRLKLKSYRPFLVVLLFTFCIWLLSDMSAKRDYPATIRVHVAGIDTARYAFISADTLIDVQFRSNGFRAFGRSMRNELQQDVVLDLKGQRFTRHGKSLCLSVCFKDYVPAMLQQLTCPGVHGITAAHDSIRFELRERKKRPFVVQLKNVEFSFAEQYGLCGMPSVTPDTVWLYGSEEALAKVGEVCTAPAAIAGISTSESYDLDLDPSWNRYGDIHASASKVKVWVPTQCYTENTIKVPLRFVSSDTSLRIRMYPDQVAVTFWVPKNRYADATADLFSAEVHYDDLVHGSQLSVRVARFPEFVRIKHVEPQSIQYVIIK